MVDPVSERRLEADELHAALAAHGFGSDRPAVGGVVLALNDPLRIVWANAGATRLFGTRDPAGLYAQVFAGRGRDGLAAAVRRLVPGGGAKTERLRLFRGFRSRSLTVSISRMRLADGEDLFVLAVPTPGDTGDAGDFATSDLRGHARDREAPAPTAKTWQAEPAVRQTPSAAARPLVPAALSAAMALGSKRFLWQTDAADRLTSLSDDAPDLAGHAAPPVGRPWVDALIALGVGSAEDVAMALAARRSWSGIRVSWPLADGSARVPVTLGGVPVRDGAIVGGFRGFGIADFAGLVAGAPAPPDAATGTPQAAADHAGMAHAPDTTVAAKAHVDDKARSASDAPRQGGSGKVVALRPYQVLSGGGLPPADSSAPPARRRDDAGPPDGDRPGPDVANLSSVEQFNFDEIARALKTAQGLRTGAGSGPGQVPAAAAPVAAEAQAAVLGRLPVAVLAVIGGRLAYANDAFLTLTGYTGLPALEQAGGLGHLLGGLELGHVAEADDDRAFPIIDAMGAVLPVEGRATTLPWGAAMALVLTLRRAVDRVAQLQNLEFDVKRRELEAAEARALLDRVSDAVATVDESGRILTLNKAAETLFGTGQRGAVGEPIGALLTPESRTAALGAVLAASAVAPPQDATLSVAGRRPAGGPLPLGMSLRAIAPGKVGVTFRDRSEVDALHRDVDHLRAELDQSGRSRSDVLAKVSHEIRTPLNAILGFAEVMLDERFGPIGNPRYKDYLTDIHVAGTQVIEFVEGLLDLSKMQAGRLQMKVAATDVNRVIGETVAGMQGQAHRDRVIVRLSLLPHLPSALVDEQAMHQVMANILSNAIRFNEPGGQVIVSTALHETGAIVVRVRDTGVGMTEAEVAMALEPFRQIGAETPGGGSGLGLPLARALVEANQATLSIKSRKTEGTMVEIVLRPAPGEALSIPAE